MAGTMTSDGSFLTLSRHSEGMPWRRFRTVSSSDTAIPAQFPMYVVSIKDLLTFDRIPSHEDLVNTGMLHRVEGDECVHFMSHVWLSDYHPDPDGVKLRHFQDICRKIIDGGDPTELFDQHDWEAFSTGCSAAKTFQALRSELADQQCLDPEAFRFDIVNGYCWIDYLSVPQETLTNSDALNDQKHAISSIPHYIERSAYFWVVAPEAMHKERQQMVGYESWQSRGWCRLEEWGNFLSIRVAPPLIVTGAHRVGVVDTMDFISMRSGIGGLAQHAACRGCFTCCHKGHKLTRPDGTITQIRCDKEEIEGTLSKMFPRKLFHYKEKGKTFMYRFLRNAAYSVYAGSSLMDPPSNARELMIEVDADTVDANYEGLTPLTWACTYGSFPIVKELLDKGARADQSVTILQCAAQRGDVEVLSLLLESGHLGLDALNKGSPKANITGLDRGAKAGHGEICRILLAAKASPDPVRKDNGHTPLHTAAEGGHAAACAALLNAGAKVDVVDTRGRTPLMLAAQRLTLFGKSTGKAQCAGLLLQAKANPYIKDASGRLPIDVAYEDKHEAFVKVHGPAEYDNSNEDISWNEDEDVTPEKPAEILCNGCVAPLPRLQVFMGLEDFLRHSGDLAGMHRHKGKMSL